MKHAKRLARMIVNATGVLLLCGLPGGVCVTFALVSADLREADRELNQLAHLLDAYYALHGEYPYSLDELTQPQGGRLIAELPADPWGNPYVYVRITPHEADLFSTGSDGRIGYDDAYPSYTWRRPTLSAVCTRAAHSLPRWAWRPRAQWTQACGGHDDR